MTEIKITPTWPEVKPKGFYVYLHRRASDGSVFYVGKGHGHRAWRFKGSGNPHWMCVATKNNVIVDIISDDMHEDCAFTLEKIIISAIGIDNLCNFGLGGSGSTGLYGDKHSNYSHDEFTFINKDGREFSGTSYEFRLKFDLNQGNISALVSGKRKSHKGWRLSSVPESDTGMSGSRVWNYDGTIRNFYNIDGRVFTGTQRDFRNKYSLHQSQVSSMIKGVKVKSTRGWFTNEFDLKNRGSSGEKNPSYKTEEFLFTSRCGDEFIGTQSEFGSKYSLDFRGVSSITTGRNKTHKGWRVEKVK